ncbi:hypothetical protein BG006_005717, partial [Podila minutissima]
MACVVLYNLLEMEEIPDDQSDSDALDGFSDFYEETDDDLGDQMEDESDEAETDDDSGERSSTEGEDKIVEGQV